MSTKYYTSGGVVLTAAQRAAAVLILDRDLRAGRVSTQAIQDIALARPRKESDAVSNSNLVHARELDITGGITTVSDLFELIDLPHRITKKAVLSIEGGTLRLEWRGEPE